MRAAPLIAVVLGSCLVAACDAAPQQPVVTVHHRCGDLNFEELSGHFGRLDGGNAVNSKHRILFSKEGDGIVGKYVGGNVERFLLKGPTSGGETLTLDESGGPAHASGNPRRIKASLTRDCRVQLDHFHVESGAERVVRDADGKAMVGTFVPYGELDRFDFEPCTEPLYLRAAAKARGKATGGTIRPPSPIVVKEESLPIGTFSPSSELGSGCSPAVDVWTDGEADAVDLPIQAARDGAVHWIHDYETQYLGVHHLAMHRKAICADGTKLLGVACTEIEVK